MYTKKSIFLSALCALFISATGQDTECIVRNSAKYELTYRAEALKKKYANPATAATNIPILIHMFVSGSASNTLTLAKIHQEIDTTNYYYQSAGLFFYECMPPDIINDDSLFDFDGYNEETTIITSHYVPNVINLYFPNTVSLGTVQVCGYSYFPPSDDVAFIASTCGANGSTLAHEIGHYFGLPHTHGFGSSSNELVNGSNCLTEGDFICDTPADPTLSSANVSTLCVYTGTVTDGNSMTYSPDTKNIMSYSRKYCRDQFTAGQNSVVNSTYLSDRTNLFCASAGLSFAGANKSNLILFPQPAGDRVTVNINNMNLNGSRVELYNGLGQCIKKETISSNMGVNTFSVKDLSEGVYYLIVLTRDSTYNSKLTISKH